MKAKLLPLLLIPILLAAGFWYSRLPNQTDRLFYAVNSGDVEGVQTAIAKGAHVDGVWASTSGPHRMFAEMNSTPLQLAVSRTRGEIIEILLKNGAEPDRTAIVNGERSEFEERPLEMSLGKQNVGIVRMLLDAKADPNHNHPLQKSKGEVEVEMLVKAGADPNDIAPNGNCLMNYAGPEPKSHPLWKLLKKHGGKPKKITGGEDTPVYFYTLRGRAPFFGWMRYGSIDHML